MQDIQVASEILEQTPAGPILGIFLAGYYPSGSSGNAPCATMTSLASVLIAENHPAALLFDLTDLDYVWGDAIVPALISLTLDRTPLIPACLVARGRTGRALTGFISHHLAQAGIAIFVDKEHALSSLRGKLGQRTV